MELSNIPGGNAKWYNHLKKTGSVQRKLDIHLTAISLLDIYPIEIET